MHTRPRFILQQERPGDPLTYIPIGHEIPDSNVGSLLRAGAIAAAVAGIVSLAMGYVLGAIL